MDKHYTVIYPAIRVHRTGCSDLKRDLRDWKVQSDGGTRTFGSLQAIVDDLNASFGWPYGGDPNDPNEEPAPWYLAALNLAPCARKDE